MPSGRKSMSWGTTVSCAAQVLDVRPVWQLVSAGWWERLHVGNVRGRVWA